VGKKVNSENGRSRIEASFVGSVSTGANEYESNTGRVWWISPYNCPFLVGARFETYEPFISSFFNFFSDCGKPRILYQ
jgi:hypothetical protein